MEIDKLIKTLLIIENVTCRRWSVVKDIVKVIPESEILKKEWYDTYKNKYQESFPLDLSKIDTWSTFDDQRYINLFFSIKDNKLLCIAKIYNSHDHNQKFTAEILLPLDFMHKIEEFIMGKFNKLAEYAYDEYLKTQKQNWLCNYKNKLIEEYDEKEKE